MCKDLNTWIYLRFFSLSFIGLLGPRQYDTGIIRGLDDHRTDRNHYFSLSFPASRSKSDRITGHSVTTFTINSDFTPEKWQESICGLVLAIIAGLLGLTVATVAKAVRLGHRWRFWHYKELVLTLLSGCTFGFGS